MIIALPFNYIYGMGGFEVDVIWAIFGIIMIASGVHLLKKFKKLGWYVFSSSYRDGFESSKKCRC